MQLGMIGLGRMSANMAMRHMKAGHECMAELSATPPSHPPGEWPTWPMDLLRKSGEFSHEG